MGLPGVKIGPLDPDKTESFGTVGKDNNARQLVRLHSRLVPPELRAALLKPHHGPRSKALKREEVAKAVASFRGEDGARAIPKGAQVVGFNVRGHEDDDDKVLTVVYRVKSGRTGKAFIPYGDEHVPDSVAAGDERTRLAEARESGAFALPKGLAELLASALGGKASEKAADSGEVVEDPRLAELLNTVDELKQRVDAAENPEPFPGYEDADVDTVKDRIGDTPEGFDRELLKRTIRAAEEKRDKPRKGVLDATEPVELAPAAEG